MPAFASPLDPALQPHLRLLLHSHRRLTGRELITVSCDTPLDALFQAPIVILSHGIESDPILNYGNAAALSLWERDWDEFTRTPSRLTAEPVSRAARDESLARVTRDGFIDDYSGVRISKSGKRFWIEKATVWNLIDGNGVRRGQAAAFAEWRYL